MSKQDQMLSSIEVAKKSIGTTWPLYSFVTSNPLSGYEKLPFQEAVVEAGQFLKLQTYPSAAIYKQALDKNDIDKALLVRMLKDNNFTDTPEVYLNTMAKAEINNTNQTKSELDVIVSKWLAVFLDEGLAEWQMPNKNKGFYRAWKSLVIYDSTFKKAKLRNLPKTSSDAIEAVLNTHKISNPSEVFTAHIAMLPGWTGYIKHRQDINSIWQQEFPINIEDYLAVRLSIADLLGLPINIVTSKTITQESNLLKHTWLKAWEETFQNKLISNLIDNNTSIKTEAQQNVPDAQMVFCIDTRSETIRRHVESSGNNETFGYAGFFGIAADYQHYQEDISIKSCPPIVGSPYKITEVPVEASSSIDTSFKTNKSISKSKAHILKRLKNMLPSSFGFVEGAGAFYGISLLAQSFVPKAFAKFNTKNETAYESFCEPKITYNEGEATVDIAIEEKVAIVKSAFDLLGWETFSPIVLFVGHGSQTTNNAFGSSLDCGACAASPGRHNARLLAALANDKVVRSILKATHNITIPEDTVFIGGEHNTTTDEIVVFDGQLPSSHNERLNKVKQNLKKAQQTATAERLLVTTGSVALAEKKALNWGETRPEWGLAKNAAFIVGGRNLTAKMNLEGRCFMHSYNWKLDPSGAALAGIMGGPMVVTQWINNHYYFTTVDNTGFGAGSKITHNITGQYGVVQGNGGDLKKGLPLQSLRASDTEMYHQPLRLTTLINAPLERVETILKANEHLQMLLDNEWMYLKVMDSTDNNTFKTYNKGFAWTLENGNVTNSKSTKTETLEPSIN